MNVYVASSWRNDYQPDVVYGLREAGHDVYDFRNPREGDNGFHWSEIDPFWKSWSPSQFAKSLEHPIAEAGFSSDKVAMEEAEACVLVLPCGRSAHLEAGWFVGRGLPVLILLSDGEPELMYKLVDSVHTDLGSLMLRLQNIEDGQPAIRGTVLPDGQPYPVV